MRQRLAARAAFAFGAALAAACGGDPSDDGGAKGSLATVPASGTGGAFCDKTLGVVVSALELCCTDGDKATPDYGLSHGIAAALLPVCRDALEASITKGRVLFVRGSADDCYAAYATTYAEGRCANITQTYADPAGPACPSSFVGVGAAGAACMGDHECEDGLTCVGYTRTSDGACVAPPAVGEPCGPAKSEGAGGGAVALAFGSHPACARGARCDIAARACVKAAAEGEACEGDEFCAAPLRCALGRCGSAGPADEGGPCLDGDDCKPHLACEREEGAERGACAPKRAAGEACTGAAFVSECEGRCDAALGQPGTCASFCGSR